MLCGAHLPWKSLALAASALFISACVAKAPAEDRAAQVRATEIAFAKTMADRDFGAFQSHLSKDAIFFGDTSVSHGVDEVSATWKPLFAKPAAPFSWGPDKVEVLASGDLALSTGPVYMDGKVVGRFNSVWRREGAGTWRIVFDKGESVCACDK